MLHRFFFCRDFFMRVFDRMISVIPACDFKALFASSGLVKTTRL
jgi:hypothetical protein